jgi:hypothetical protein
MSLSAPQGAVLQVAIRGPIKSRATASRTAWWTVATAGPGSGKACVHAPVGKLALLFAGATEAGR